MITDQWVRRYRPTKIEDYIFQDEKSKVKIIEYITKKEIPHLLLYGIAGTGKTSLARLLMDHMDIDPDMDILEINASDNNSVDDIRGTVCMFARNSPMGKFKIIHLKECDRLSPAAQDALRDVMEEYDFQCRFIMTCNHVNKVSNEIKSRVTSYGFTKPNKDAIIERIANILIAEKVEPNEYILDYIDRSYPDVRNIIMNVENGVVNGILQPPSVDAGNKESLIAIAECIEDGNWTAARQKAMATVAPEDWEDVYRFLYENVNLISSDVQKQEQALVTIAEYLYKHSFVADPEINASAMFIMLGKI